MQKDIGLTFNDFAHKRSKIAAQKLVFYGEFQGLSLVYWRSASTIELKGRGTSTIERPWVQLFNQMVADNLA